MHMHYALNTQTLSNTYLTVTTLTCFNVAEVWAKCTRNALYHYGHIGVSTEVGIGLKRVVFTDGSSAKVRTFGKNY